jgi:hypothetical protein
MVCVLIKLSLLLLSKYGMCTIIDSLMISHVMETGPQIFGVIAIYMS